MTDVIPVPSTIPLDDNFPLPPMQTYHCCSRLPAPVDLGPAPTPLSPSLLVPASPVIAVCKGNQTTSNLHHMYTFLS